MSTQFTPTETGTYRLNFRMRQAGYAGDDHIAYIDDVRINELTNETMAITSTTDYYPFGMPMPGRQLINGEPYRYGYQGEFAEKDPETGMEAFELRLWDSRIGRWLTVDPAKQYVSPYLGMGNNPISRVDPDGGTDTDDWYEILDSKGNGTGQYTWIDGSGYQEGYKYIGFFAWQTDAFNNTTFYDGVTQASYYNGKPLEYFGGQLEELVVTADIRSFGQKSDDFARGVVNPYVRTYTKLNTILTRQLNVIIEEGVHPGRAYSYDSYKGWNYYQELDKNWNFIDIPLSQSSDLETMMDAVSVNPAGVELNLLKNKVMNWVVDEAATTIIKESAKETLNTIHSGNK